MRICRRSTLRPFGGSRSGPGGNFFLRILGASGGGRVPVEAPPVVPTEVFGVLASIAVGMSRSCGVHYPSRGLVRRCSMDHRRLE